MLRVLRDVGRLRGFLSTVWPRHRRASRSEHVHVRLQHDCMNGTRRFNSQTHTHSQTTSPLIHPPPSFLYRSTDTRFVTFAIAS
jgi:hypothetical protein